MDTLRDLVDGVGDGRLWLLVGLCVATALTLQQVETVVEGAWPHQRRPAQRSPRARHAEGLWGSVGLLLLPGLLLGILNLAVLVWRERDETEAQVIGSLLVGLGWVAFVLASTERLPIGRYLRSLGLVGPAALAALLLVGDALLLIAFLDVLPSLDTVTDALRDAVPFV
ncbi:MAG: hypothetical protein AVDCRST_MAG49-2314 [uncultured Thermomicrobiales bacterium]|uniref:Uncharacterized protein n=1 Tax=uncultured Thermomicrobiales bacterium TaxID=1645740 RepID=A0A6J4UU68_9BACT|nr:MAG: hypothetical protein AVDCRST_MAG49-2314 [uncultured Thermomicrobiales bacterium]